MTSAGHDLQGEQVKVNLLVIRYWWLGSGRWDMHASGVAELTAILQHRTARKLPEKEGKGNSCKNALRITAALSIYITHLWNISLCAYPPTALKL